MAMANDSKAAVGVTIGIDLGDRWSHVCVLDEQGEVLEESRIPTTHKALSARFGGVPPARFVIETGTHSNWVHEVLSASGHEVFIANARRVRAISANERKDDRTDAQMLARLGRFDPRLLSPVEARSEETRRDLSLLRSRAALVTARTMLVNHARGTVKACGHRLPKCSTASIHKSELPVEIKDALAPVFVVLEQLSDQIRSFDARLKELCEKTYPHTRLLRQVAGVGPVTALCFALTIEDPARFKSNRAIGPYTGLVPRRDQSGDRDPQLRITKTGDPMLRTLLVQSAHYILGPFGPPSALREFGQRLASRGGTTSKKQAVVATARKLAVVLLSIWRNAEVYEPLRGSRTKASA